MKATFALFSILFLATMAGLILLCRDAAPAVGPLPRSRPERRAEGGIVWRRQDYEDYVTKAMKEPAFVKRELILSGMAFQRAETLVRAGIVRKILLESPCRTGSLFSTEQSSEHVLIAGPAERVVQLQTMIQDEMTFLFATRREALGNTLFVLALVDPVFLETDRRRASRIAEESYEGVKRILKPQAHDYRRADRRVWFNRELGTVTILDRPERIEKVRDYLAIRPYAPRPRTY